MRTTLWASTCWPSSQARVTSVNSLSSLSSPKAELIFRRKSFHCKQSFSSDRCIFKKSAFLSNHFSTSYQIECDLTSAERRFLFTRRLMGILMHPHGIWVIPLCPFNNPNPLELIWWAETISAEINFQFFQFFPTAYQVTNRECVAAVWSNLEFDQIWSRPSSSPPTSNHITTGDILEQGICWEVPWNSSNILD